MLRGRGRLMGLGKGELGWVANGSRMKTSAMRPSPKPEHSWLGVNFLGQKGHACTKFELICDVTACLTARSRLITTLPLVMIQVGDLTQEWYSSVLEWSMKPPRRWRGI